MLKNWNDLFELFLSADVERQILGDNMMMIWVAKGLLVFKKGNNRTSFRKQFITNLTVINCRGEFTKHEVQQLFNDSSDVIFVTDLSGKNILGFAFIIIRDHAPFAKEHSRIRYNYYGVALEPKMDISKILEVKLICSQEGTKTGERMLKCLSDNPFQKTYEAIALMSVPNRYTYYIKQGFYRTNDFHDVYPAFRDNGEVHYDYAQTAKRLKDTLDKNTNAQDVLTLASLMYFKNECNDACNRFGFLFMKPTAKLRGGFKSRLRSSIR